MTQDGSRKKAEALSNQTSRMGASGNCEEWEKCSKEALLPDVEGSRLQ